jgi:hypothetical protein
MKTKEEIEARISHCAIEFEEAKGNLGKAGDIEENLDIMNAMQFAQSLIVALEWVISED